MVGATTISSSSGAEDLQGIEGHVHVEGGCDSSSGERGIDTLVIRDENSTGDLGREEYEFNVALFANGICWNVCQNNEETSSDIHSTPEMTYSGLARVTLEADDFGGEFTVRKTLAGTELIVNGRGGDDAFLVDAPG